MKQIFSFIFLLFISTSLLAVEDYTIESKVLGYKLKYWVHVPEGASGPLPVLYVTDGGGYLRNGLPEVSKELIESGKTNPHIIVLVSAVNPDKPSENRRNSQFLCNPKYVRFYKEELIPEIDNRYKTIKEASGRGILGLSFGGLNAMYFAIQAHDTFGNIGIQSPAPHPCPNIYDDFSEAARLPINIFLSTGTVNDKERATKRLKSILEEKGYEFTYMEVAEGHNWRNWKPMLDDILLCFYGKENQP